MRVSAWAVLNGLLIPVAHWDRQDPDGWPEQVRATAAFAMGMLTELEDHGADLGACHQFKFVEEMNVIAGLDSRPDLLALKPVEFEHLIRELFDWA